MNVCVEAEGLVGDGIDDASKVNPGRALRYSMTGPNKVLKDDDNLCDIEPSAQMTAHSSGSEGLRVM